MPVDEPDLLALPARPKARPFRVEGLLYLLVTVRKILEKGRRRSGRSG
jgi:hypothetical protein